MASTRLVCSNIAKDLSVSDEEDPIYTVDPIIGLQCVFDSVTYSTSFFLRKSEISLE